MNSIVPCASVSCSKSWKRSYRVVETPATPDLSGAAPFWDVRQRVLGPQTLLGFENPLDQELVVFFGIVLDDESLWPLTNSPFQVASKIAANFLYFFCLQESLHCNEGVIWWEALVRAYSVQVLPPPSQNPTLPPNQTMETILLRLPLPSMHSRTLFKAAVKQHPCT